MRVAIVGAGSIGAVLGGKLAASGHEVVLVARGAHLEALRERGLALVDHVDAASGTYRLPASDEPADFGGKDLVVIGLKAHAIPAMLPRMKPLVRDETVVVAAINGTDQDITHEIKTSFLAAGKWDAVSFSDVPGDRTKLTVNKSSVTSASAVNARMSPGGGFVMVIRPAR